MKIEFQPLEEGRYEIAKIKAGMVFEWMGKPVLKIRGGACFLNPDDQYGHIRTCEFGVKAMAKIIGQMKFSA